MQSVFDCIYMKFQTAFTVRLKVLLTATPPHMCTRENVFNIYRLAQCQQENGEFLIVTDTF